MSTKTIISGITLLASGLLWADESAFDGGFDMNGKLSQQKYEQGAYKTARLALQPWLGYGNWMAYAELPFEGHELSFNGTTNGVVVRRGPLGRIIRIPVKQQTSVTQKTEGIADASIGFSYALPFIAQPWLADVALDYKFANGDVEKGLGNGSRDLSLSTALQYKFDRLSLAGSVGRTFVDAKDDGATSSSNIPNNSLSTQDYTFWSASAKFNISKVWTTGLSYSDQSDPYDNAPPQTVTGATLEWRAQSFLKLVLGYNRYAHDDQNIQPRNEASLGANFSL